MTLGKKIRAIRHRKAWSQETLAAKAKLKTLTLRDIENGKTQPRFQTIQKIARALDVSPEELTASRMSGRLGTDDLKRREFLQLLSVIGGTLTVPMNLIDWERLDDAFDHPGRLNAAAFADLSAVNRGLWGTYRAVRDKRTVLGSVLSHLGLLEDALDRVRADVPRRELCALVSDLTQLGGEIFFEAGRYTDAGQCYAVAVSAAAEASVYDLWACALVRNAFLPIYEQQYRRALLPLQAASTLAGKGDPTLTTRHWVAMVTADAYAGLGAEQKCRAELDRAADVCNIPGATGTNGTWLRFHDDRIAEARGSCLAKLGLMDLAEPILEEALAKHPNPTRRRGMVLSDLTFVAAARGDVDRVCTLADEVISIAGSGSAGVLSRKLGFLYDSGHGRVEALAARINTLAGE